MKVLSGLYDERDPHVSFSQLDTAASCLSWHEGIYEKGLTRDSRTAAWGRVGHEALAAINRAAKAAGPEGLSTADLDAAKRILVKMHDYGLYTTMCGWLERYAEKVNTERSSLLGVEVDVVAWLRIGTVKRNPKKVWIMDLDAGKWTRGCPRNAAVKLVGRLDRLLRGSLSDDCRFTDFKLWGSIPSTEDLKTRFQFGIYNWSLRQEEQVQAFGLNPLQVFQAEWWSIFSNSCIPVALDVEQANQAEDFARKTVLTLIEETERPESYSRRCGLCPRSEGGRCRTYRREITGDGEAKAMPATLDAYLKLGDRESLIRQWREKMRERLRSKLESRAGETIREHGAEARLAHRKGGLPEKYLGLTREELLKLLEREPRTDVEVGWLPGRRARS